MASAVSESDLSDVDWLVMRARSFPKTDPYSTKAWLITAKSLFPGSFVIQFESYLVEKTAKNVDEAARHLQDMLQSFPKEPRLWAEIHSILESLQREPQDQKITFLTELFAAIPTSTQCQMLVHVSDTINDTLERCQLMLLAMRRFPNLVQEHGLKLVEMLVKEETNSGLTVNNPVNRYRKLLVVDVMPLVLQRSGHLDVNMFTLCLWLQRAIEFYVSYVSQSGPEAHGDTTDPPQLRSPIKGRRTSGLVEPALQVNDPWGSLLKLLMLIGQRLQWDMERDLVTKSKQYQIQSLLHHLLRVSGGSKVSGESTVKQIQLTAMVLFVFAMVNYVGYVDTQGSSAVGSSHLVPIVILESLTTTKSESPMQPRTKKAKHDSSKAPSLHPSPSITSSANICDLFKMAVNCFEILNSTDAMRFEFYNLCQNWKPETKNMLNLFQVDMFIYQANYPEAISLLETLCESSKGKLQTRLSLQMACCYYSMKHYSKSAVTAMDVIDTIPSSPSQSKDDTSETPPSSSSSSSPSSSRVLLMVPCTDAEVLPFCLQIIISGLRAMMMTSRSDDRLAQLLILLQHDWPTQEPTFCEVMEVITKQGSFTYNTFFSHVTQVDILEEFAFLDTPEGGKVDLDIMPVSTKAIAQQRTITRGVNKGAKEDFKAALEKQLGVISESCDTLIRKFLRDEREEILQSLA